MVYKVIGNISDENFQEIINELMEYNRFIYKNGNLYIALDNYKDKKENEEIIKLFKEKWREKEIYTIDITLDNLKNENQEVIDWCKENLIRLERKRYEENEQPRLQRMYEIIDLTDEIMSETIKNINKKDLQKGGINGKTKKKQRKKRNTGRRPIRNK